MEPFKSSKNRKAALEAAFRELLIYSHSSQCLIIAWLLALFASFFILPPSKIYSVYVVFKVFRTKIEPNWKNYSDSFCFKRLLNIANKKRWFD